MYRSRITNQAIKAKKSKTEVQEVALAALDQSIRVLINIRLISIKLLSFPSKLLEFRSRQRHQKPQEGIISQIFRILTLQQLWPQQERRSITPHGITQRMLNMLKMKFQISLAAKQCNRRGAIDSP